MAPRRSRKKAGKVAPGAERRRQRRLEEGVLEELESCCDLAEEDRQGHLEKSREGHVIELRLEGCRMSVLPDSIGGLKALTQLDLTECLSLTTLPESIGGLTALEKLFLPHCVALTALPDTIGELNSLTNLDLSACNKLVALPDSIGGLKALTVLDLAECMITTLPDTIGGLTALKNLYLNKSPITALPDAIGDLKALTLLALVGCSSLAELPDAIGGLTALEELHLPGCESLTSLPNSIGELKALTVLDLEVCESLTSLPDTIGGLTALKELDLKGCKILAALPPAIETMPNLDIKGWEPPLAGCERFADLARPRVKALYPERADEDIDGMISRYYWSSACERAKIDDTHDGMVYEQLLVDNFIEVIRRIRRRICDACGRRGEIEEDRFPVCWCGARRYCGEECQKLDWDRGHSRTCASGYTWSATDLHWFRRFEEDRVLREQVVDDGHPSFLFDEGMVQLRQALIARNPPPADRER